MMKKRIAMAGGLLLVVLLTGIAVWQVRQSREPVHEGRTLSQWMDHHVASSAANPPYGSAGWKKAHEAIRIIGTNGIPTLLAMIGVTERDLPMRLQKWATSHGLFKDSYRSAGRQNDEALYAFEILGTNAVSAVPELAEIYRRAKSLYSQSCAALALGHIGRGAEAALPVLLANFKHTNSEVRFYAVSGVIDIGGDAGVVVPGLRSMIGDSKMETRWNAIVGLSRYGRRAGEAVPDLLRCREKEIQASNLELTKQIDVALWRIAPEKTAKAVTVEQRTPMVMNGATTEPLDLEIDGDRRTLIKPGTALPATRQSWTNDPRGRVRFFRGSSAAGTEQLLGEFEVMGLPPKPEKVHAYIICGVVDGNIFICARDVNSNELLEVRRVE